MFTLPYFSVSPNNLLCHTMLLHTQGLHTQTCALSILWCSSIASAKMSCCICSPFSSSKCNKASPASLQTYSRALLSSCCHKNLKALHSWCWPFLPSPALQREMYLLFLHIDISCKDNLDYSLLALRIKWSPSMQPWLQCVPSHQTTSLWRLLLFRPTSLEPNPMILELTLSTKEKITSRKS